MQTNCFTISVVLPHMIKREENYYTEFFQLRLSVHNLSSHHYISEA